MKLAQQNMVINNNYVINMKDELGKGAQGAVYSCSSRDPPNLNLCAKVLNVQNHNDLAIKREIEIINLLKDKAMSNPNVVRVYHIEQTNSQVIIIMEKCQSDLKQLLSVRKQLSVAESIDILKQLINGYKVCYDNKILHRDIKPDNILYNQNQYKLADFGVGRIGGNQLLMTIQGSPAYQAPQLLFGLSHQAEATSKVDVYSLGLLVHLMIFGGLPIKVDSIGNLRESLSNLKISPVKINPYGLNGMTQEIATLIESMLKYEEVDRISWDELFNHPLVGIKIPQRLSIIVIQPTLSQQTDQPVIQPVLTPAPLLVNQNIQQNQQNVPQKLQLNVQQPPPATTQTVVQSNPANSIIVFNHSIQKQPSAEQNQQNVAQRLQPNVQQPSPAQPEKYLKQNSNPPIELVSPQRNQQSVTPPLNQCINLSPIRPSIVPKIVQKKVQVQEIIFTTEDLRISQNIIANQNQSTFQTYTVKEKIWDMLNWFYQFTTKFEAFSQGNQQFKNDLNVGILLLKGLVTSLAYNLDNYSRKQQYCRRFLGASEEIQIQQAPSMIKEILIACVQQQNKIVADVRFVTKDIRETALINYRSANIELDSEFYLVYFLALFKENFNVLFPYQNNQEYTLDYLRFQAMLKKLVSSYYSFNNLNQQSSVQYNEYNIENEEELRSIIANN